MRIGIIGAGGAGLCTAWLLEEAHDVILLERNAVPGGHARTTTATDPAGHEAHASDGFNWFSDAIYPRFVRLLELIGQPTVRVPMSAGFLDRRVGRTLCMPPIGARRLGSVLLHPGDLWTLLRMWRAIAAARPLVLAHDSTVTCGDFLAHLNLGERFKAEFLAPFLTAAWGCPRERTADCAIYPLMKYFVFHAPNGLSHYWWQIVEGGAAAYARRMAASLDRAQLHLNAPAEGITRTAHGYRVVAGGRTFELDRLVVATGAAAAQRLLAGTEGIDSARQALDRFEYYVAHLATHSDLRWMPPDRRDWCVSNVVCDRDRADLTVWSGFRPPGDSRPPADVFTSTVDPDHLPEPLHHLSRFELPLETPAHFEAQKALAAVQGEADLWFAGDYTRDIGSHEDAICSAIEVAKRLAPDSARLRALQRDRQIPSIPAPNCGKEGP